MLSTPLGPQVSFFISRAVRDSSSSSHNRAKENLLLKPLPNFSSFCLGLCWVMCPFMNQGDEICWKNQSHWIPDELYYPHPNHLAAINLGRNGMELGRWSQRVAHFSYLFGWCHIFFMLLRIFWIKTAQGHKPWLARHHCFQEMPRAL